MHIFFSHKGGLGWFKIHVKVRVALVYYILTYLASLCGPDQDGRFSTERNAYAMDSRWNSSLLLFLAAWFLLLQPSAGGGFFSKFIPKPKSREISITLSHPMRPQSLHIILHGRDFAPSRLRRNGGIGTTGSLPVTSQRGLEFCPPVYGGQITTDPPLEDQGSALLPTPGTWHVSYAGLSSYTILLLSGHVLSRGQAAQASTPLSIASIA
ncbi:hypothetical protein L249_6883 [Ophiocordyceps polyrhachis-furcata BCC 54312]|uniref:Uncharacterized protein n=1 Tax=Ophiocordyceps polyrhachis-furcata BCC 54312 TaxID=1330021 RepID=A0A367LL63_9HYPO|nr:hypothetical protein L249_6883 [Ophiocordyceps polyrhachis-furcata BCC 54312]